MKLPDADADDVGGGVMAGIGDEDGALGDAAAEILCLLLVALEITVVGEVVGALLVVPWLVREVMMMLVDIDRREEPLELNCDWMLLEYWFMLVDVIAEEAL